MEIYNNFIYFCNFYIRPLKDFFLIKKFYKIYKIINFIKEEIKNDENFKQEMVIYIEKYKEEHKEKISLVNYLNNYHHNECISINNRYINNSKVQSLIKKAKKNKIKENEKTEKQVKRLITEKILLSTGMHAYKNQIIDTYTITSEDIDNNSKIEINFSITFANFIIDNENFLTEKGKKYYEELKNRYTLYLTLLISFISVIISLFK